MSTPTLHALSLWTAGMFAAMAAPVPMPPATVALPVPTVEARSAEAADPGSPCAGGIACMSAPRWACLTGGTGIRLDECNATPGADPFDLGCELP